MSLLCLGRLSSFSPNRHRKKQTIKYTAKGPWYGRDIPGSHYSLFTCLGQELLKSADPSDVRCSSTECLAVSDVPPTSHPGRVSGPEVPTEETLTFLLNPPSLFVAHPLVGRVSHHYPSPSPALTSVPDTPSRSRLRPPLSVPVNIPAVGTREMGPVKVREGWTHTCREGNREISQDQFRDRNIPVRSIFMDTNRVFIPLVPSTSQTTRS